MSFDFPKQWDPGPGISRGCLYISKNLDYNYHNQLMLSIPIERQPLHLTSPPF
jgi:hypothetical protein